MSEDKISLITPIYNQEKAIKKYVSNLKNQTYGFENIEIIMVNDGSNDDTHGQCSFYASKYDNIIYLNEAHNGVSAARNRALEIASGKYIFFLDVDDELSNNTILDCVEEFDKIYDDVDLLTYPIETHYKGRVLQPHFRYRYLKENGAYDLCKEAFIGQTTMNIVIKNLFENNIKFDEELEFSEDQKYCCDVLHNKLKIGFCNTAKYTYYRTENSSSGKLAGACFIFEKSLSLFEDIFSKYEHVPVAIQGLYVNDIYWKMIENIYFPWHYDDAKYEYAMARVKKLLRKCYNYVILDHPNLDYYEKFFLLKLKGDDSAKCVLSANDIQLVSEGNVVLKQNSMELVVTKVQVRNRHIRMRGFLKSAFFEFYNGPIELNAIENKMGIEYVKLHRSAHSYYRCHEATQKFYAMEYEIDIDKVSELEFKVVLGDTELPVSYYFMPLVPFSNGKKEYIKDEVTIRFENNKWFFSSCESVKKNQELWLYYDCKGVEFDNGLKQFLHDSDLHDDVKKIYVVSDKRQLKHIPLRLKLNSAVAFGTEKHKKLFLQADKLITAFIENDNLIPFKPKEYALYSDKMHFETIYLQHGILHIDMPWKYSPEKIIADKVVVSSNVDYKLFKKNGYLDDELLKIGMPRFSNIEVKNNSKKKILFAPSWRSYLVSNNGERGWKLLNGRFENSNYYIGIKEFLSSSRLQQLLNENDIVLDVKLHPIFSNLKNDFNIHSERIRFVDLVDESEYQLFITDFSSYMFDFIHRNIPVLSFIPDYAEFTCGMNGYRKVDFFDKANEKYICKSADEILSMIDLFIDTGEAMDYSVEFYGGTHPMDELYKSIIG